MKKLGLGILCSVTFASLAADIWAKNGGDNVGRALSWETAVVVIGLAFFCGAVLWLSGQRRNRLRSERLNQVQKMESLGQLAGGIAHDFNNMLGGILGAAEILRRQLGEDDPRRKYAEIIVNTAVKAGDLTSKLLLFSRRPPKKSETFRLRECIGAALCLLEPALNKKYKIITDFGLERDCVSGDSTQVENVVMNLVMNAKDAMPAGGVIRIGLRQAVVDKKRGADKLPAGTYAELCVEDKGCGIPKEIRHKIFEPFFTTKESGKGTGLGLAAVYGIVREHGGHITFESSENGSVFRVFLPLTEKLPPAVAVSDAPEPLKAKVLVADDEKILSELVKEILELLGAQAVTVNDPREAAAVYAREKDFDLVMLDVVMPEKSGRAVYEELKALNPRVKVIFMSGYDKDRELFQSTADENVGFLGKPFSAEECYRQAAKMLAKK